MICPSCERDCPDGYMSAHHLRTKKEDKKETEYLCRDCHGFIHALYSNKQLADPETNLDSIEGLKSQKEFRSAVSFIKKIPAGRKVKIKESKEKRRH